PAESLHRAENGEGLDCDDQAILLCSLLRVFIPPEKVFCAPVMWSMDGTREGHMCVIMGDEFGQDRILEATADPDKPVCGLYEVYALFNDKYAFASKAGLSLFDLRPVEKVLAGTCVW
ncbi:MAG: hypothetical protein PHU23_01190, partial [Dehalococcoidales bacterium]|nr:hypothetical protein [Dehalococcoidales bacterium]